MNFKRSNRIQDDDGILGENILEGKEENCFFFFFFNCIFSLSPYMFTQMSSVYIHWIQNSIPHPTRTHSAYFLVYLHKIKEKRKNN